MGINYGFHKTQKPSKIEILSKINLVKAIAEDLCFLYPLEILTTT